MHVFAWGRSEREELLRFLRLSFTWSDLFSPFSDLKWLFLGLLMSLPSPSYLFLVPPWRKHLDFVLWMKRAAITTDISNLARTVSNDVSNEPSNLRRSVPWTHDFPHSSKATKSLAQRGVEVCMAQRGHWLEVILFVPFLSQVYFSNQHQLSYSLRKNVLIFPLQREKCAQIIRRISKDWIYKFSVLLYCCVYFPTKSTWSHVSTKPEQKPTK